MTDITRPLDRLVLSRQRIRAELAAITHPPAKPSFLSRPGPLRRKVAGLLRDLPGVSPVEGSVREWWADHPAHQAGIVAGKLSATVVRPVARAYPRSTLVAAGAVGAAVVLIKPWRWVFRPRLLLGAAAQIGTRQLKKPRKTPWRAVLASMARSR